MLEAREDAPLLEEASHQAARGVADDLDGDALRELTVVTHAEKHVAHTALADRALDAKRADASGGWRIALLGWLACPRRIRRQAAIEDRGPAMSAEEIEKVRAERGVAGRDAIHERRLLQARLVEQRVERGVETLMAIVGGR
jgi:hypothetical protein